MRFKRRLFGLVAISFGMGMIVGLVFNSWAFIFAAIIVALGFWLFVM